MKEIFEKYNKKLVALKKAGKEFLDLENDFKTKEKIEEYLKVKEKLDALMEYSPLVRNRLTLMRLRRTVIREENK